MAAIRTAGELVEALSAFDPDTEVTVAHPDGDYVDEHEIEGLIDWGSFVSIQHGRKSL